MNRCSSIARLLPLYAGGDLDPEKMGMISAHLAGCRSCARAAGELKDARNWIQSAAMPEFDDETIFQLRQSIRRKIDTNNAEVDWWGWMTISWRPAVLAAGAVLLAGALILSLWNRKPAGLAKHE